MTRIAIAGAAGKMGRMLIETVNQQPDLQLTVALERPGLDVVGRDAGEVAGLGPIGVLIADSLEAGIDDFDVLIDFTIASATATNMETCAAKGRKMVIGTTGLSDDQRERLSAIAADVAVVFASNYSVGVNATFKLLEVAAQIMGPDVDVEISEIHHRHKVDAPSGTALTMGEVIAGVRGQVLNEVAIHGRQGQTGERPVGDIGFHSVRAGDVVGEHTVVFAGQGERLEITHRAHSRSNFAEGAVRAATWVASQDKGLFDMRDVLGLDDIGS